MQSRHTHRHRGITAAGALASAMLAALCLAAPTLGARTPGAAAHSASASAGGAIQLFVTPTLTGRGGGPVLITGAIGDHGRSVKTNATGRPERKGHFVVAKLRMGTILIDTLALGKKLNKAFRKTRLDKASCSIHGSTAAVLRIVSGTGAYAGISGSVRVRFAFAELAARYTKGAKKGRCNLNGPAAAEWATLIGAGTVSF